MRFIEMKIKAAAPLKEAVAAALANIGIYDMQIDDPSEILELIADLGDTEWYDLTQIPDEILNGGNSQDVTFTLYFEKGCEGAAEAERARAALADLDLIGIETRERDDSEWKDNWKEYYKTSRVGERVVVSPTWENVTQADYPDDILIKMDPGMAFGTGTHETTSLAIRMLEKYVKPGDRVLDIGTGSGVLSIVAAKLGASDVLGVDIDPDAVGVARENIGTNGVSGIARAVCRDLAEGLDYTADVVAANLLADLVIRFSGDAYRHTVPGGVFISSGILTEKQPLVEEAVRNAGFEILEVMTDGEWCGIAARRP